MDDLEKNCWYWCGDPREGGVWYPCYVLDNGQIMMDGHKKDADLYQGLEFIKAVVPN